MIFVDLVMQFARSLGSKPEAITQMEVEMWRIVCDVASGEDVVNGLKGFFGKFYTLERSGIPMERNWFCPGESPNMEKKCSKLIHRL